MGTYLCIYVCICVWINICTWMKFRIFFISNRNKSTVFDKMELSGWKPWMHDFKLYLDYRSKEIGDWGINPRQLWTRLIPWINILGSHFHRAAIHSHLGLRDPWKLCWWCGGSYKEWVLDKVPANLVLCVCVCGLMGQQGGAQVQKSYSFSCKNVCPLTHNVL